MGFRRRPFRPILPQLGVVGRGSAFDHHMSPDFAPAELGQEEARLFVAKHPVVLSAWVQVPPVSLFPPIPGFRRMGSTHEVHLVAEHPVVEVFEDLTCHRGAMIRPLSPDDGGQGFDYCSGVTAAQSPPFRAQCGLDLPYRRIARCDQQLVSRAGCFDRVVSDVPAEEVKAFRQVNDARLFLREGQATYRQPFLEDADHRFGIFPAFDERQLELPVATTSVAG